MTAMIRISEIFGPTIQGEGALIGQPTLFVRTGGCDYRCAWCDTLHAVDSAWRHEWHPMRPEEIFDQIQKLSGGVPIMVSLSGGNPAIQPLGDLITMGKQAGYGFCLETQGTIAQNWFADLDVLTLSPKPPSSGHQTDWAAFDKCLTAAGSGPQTVLKIVIFDDCDYDYARDVATRYPDLPIYLQPGNPTQPPAVPDHQDMMARMRWLVEKAAADQWFSATILPQLHVLLWGSKRGV